MNSINLTMDSSLNPSQHPAPKLQHHKGVYTLQFECMASLCEILLDAPTATMERVQQISKQAVTEAWRIESKYSRYQTNNVWQQLHATPNTPQKIDVETQQLLSFAYQAWALSDGLFDITSGILRRVWRFAPNSRLPTQLQIDQLLPLIGMQRLGWQPSEPEQLTIPQGMELDFGGIGKEYAVDEVLGLCQALLLKSQIPFRLLVNFGGDLACCHSFKDSHLKDSHFKDNKPWRVGIESTDIESTNLDSTKNKHTKKFIDIRSGALATSGDTKRCIVINGQRYGHILNPKTGWPIRSVYRSVSVAGNTCVNAGMLATFGACDQV